MSRKKMIFKFSSSLTGEYTPATLRILAFCIFLYLPVEINAQNHGIAETFQNPDAQYRPHTRMWIPQSAIEEKTLISQIADLADAGVGDIELVAFDIERRGFRQSAEAKPLSVSKAKYGWGTPNWTNSMQILLDEAGKQGIKATFTIGPAWPVASPLLKKSSPGVEVQLAYTKLSYP